jgi:hypothetical protein
MGVEMRGGVGIGGLQGLKIQGHAKICSRPQIVCRMTGNPGVTRECKSSEGSFDAITWMVSIESDPRISRLCATLMPRTQSVQESLSPQNWDRNPH